jgi:very-short-patch-repair endonuclease
MSHKFFKLTDKERLVKYTELYNDQKLSWATIAKKFNTYSNKVRRDAEKLGMESRDKSMAQKVAISEGRHEHPTKGKQQSESTKIKISESQGKVWDEMDELERAYRSQIGTDAWNKKTPYERAEFFKKSSEAIQEASRNGSKVEKYLFEYLIGEGYRVDKHKEHILQNEKFHIDLYIRDCRMAIEVDGPMHFEPVFGEDKLQKRQAADLAKNGLILSAGMVLIRVKLIKRESQRYLRQISDEVMEIVKSVEKNFPSKNKRYFEV